MIPSDSPHIACLFWRWILCPFRTPVVAAQRANSRTIIDTLRMLFSTVHTRIGRPAVRFSSLRVARQLEYVTLICFCTVNAKTYAPISCIDMLPETDATLPRRIRPLERVRHTNQFQLLWLGLRQYLVSRCSRRLPGIRWTSSSSNGIRRTHKNSWNALFFLLLLRAVFNWRKPSDSLSLNLLHVSSTPILYQTAPYDNLVRWPFPFACEFVSLNLWLMFLFDERHRRRLRISRLFQQNTHHFGHIVSHPTAANKIKRTGWSRFIAGWQERAFHGRM